MSENKDQTIARLEGEASGLRQARTVLIADRERLQGELAASRELGPCGKHPKSCYERVVHTPIPDELPDMTGYVCTICAELATTRADALLAACATICVNCDIKTPLSDGKNGMHLGGLHCYAWAVRKLVTTSDAAAREDWIRRIRLEEAE